MKRILVLSDMHIPSKLNDFPVEIIKPYISQIDYIFGLGDYNSEEGLNYLYGFGKEVYAVSGNMDPFAVMSRLQDKIILNIEDINIGLIHGWGSPAGIRDKIKKEFKEVDLICYGHTHTAYFSNEKPVAFFNPGSVCGNNAGFGILTIDKNNINAKIINF